MMTVVSVNRIPSNRTATRAATPAQGIPVLPAVDINYGTVTFFTPSGHHSHWSAEPGLLVDALAQAVRSPQWIPEIGTLVITVAETGVRSGRRLGFKLQAF
ncbi:hypothetical protein G6034_02455 [Arthrobacter sp. AETb3-4]|jgi:hypothetical protein|uniref:Uncharacterized protein n=2 Tax=Arthrobacter wenxiniae TaxID=2713570 RepID=A0A7Y7IE21_9MICC|nr:hypothetical protein [Arthrobacter wenxiniae]